MIFMHIEVPLMILDRFTGNQFLFGERGKILAVSSMVLLIIISSIYYLGMRNGERIVEMVKKKRVAKNSALIGFIIVLETSAFPFLMMGVAIFLTRHGFTYSLSPQR